MSDAVSTAARHQDAESTNVQSAGFESSSEEEIQPVKPIKLSLLKTSSAKVESEVEQP